jgi:hypothetical protein
MQIKWNKTALRDNEIVDSEYAKSKKRAFKVIETDAFSLHKFSRAEQPVTITTPTKAPQGIERLLVGSNVMPTLEHFSANIPGLLSFMKFQT